MYLPEYRLIIYLDIFLSILTVLVSMAYLCLWCTLPKYVRERRGNIGHQITWIIVLTGQGLVAAFLAYFSFALIRWGLHFPIEWWLLLGTGALFSMLSTSMLMLSVSLKDSLETMKIIQYLNKLDKKILQDRAHLERGQ